MKPRARFYREVAVRSPEKDGAPEWTILLDGKPIRTPAGAPFVLPNVALAEAIAEEWRAQTETIRPESMLMTRLVQTAIDRIESNRPAAIAPILDFAKSDLICYRAETPERLVRRQAAEWDPLLNWAGSRYGAVLVTTAGIGFVEQPPDALAALEAAVTAYDDLMLAGLHAAAALLGSAVIALALAEGDVTADRAFALAHLDEIYQAERWGQDREEHNRFLRKAAELAEIAQFFKIYHE